MTEWADERPQRLEAELRARVEELTNHIKCHWCGFVWNKLEVPERHECSNNPLVIERDTLQARLTAVVEALESAEHTIAVGQRQYAAAVRLVKTYVDPLDIFPEDTGAVAEAIKDAEDFAAAREQPTQGNQEGERA